jgi:hypothetical protein
MTTPELWLAAGSMPGLWVGGWLPEELAGAVCVTSARSGSTATGCSEVCVA